MKKFITALSLAVCVSLVGCASSDVQASADSGDMVSDAEMSCCAETILAEKSDCGDCGANVEGKVVCPASGTVYDAEEEM